MLGTILLILLILLLIGAVPAWPYSRSWGYAPSGLLTILVIVAIVALLTGYVYPPVLSPRPRSPQRVAQLAGAAGTGLAFAFQLRLDRLAAGLGSVLLLHQ